MTKRELRILFINHPAAKEIIETHFYDVFSYVDNESLYWNQINFLETIRVKNLWDKLKKVMEK